MENKRIIQVDEKVPFKMLVPLSIQHMFAMFGASVLVPKKIKLKACFAYVRKRSCIIHERSWDFIIHPDHEGESTGISWFEFRVSCTGWNCYLKMGIQLCTGRLCCSRILRMCFISDYL